MGNFSKEDIIKGIRERRSTVLEFLYLEYYPMIKSLILRNNGTETEAQDIFQDTIIIIYEKTKSSKLVITSSFKTYFYAICKKLWLQRLPNLRRTVPTNHSDEEWSDILGWEEFLESEEEKLFYHHFRQLDKECQKILLNYFNKKRYKDQAKTSKLKPAYIKKLKFKCKEKLYKRIANDPIYKELMESKRTTGQWDINIKDNNKANPDSDSNSTEK
jgi:RNA polymerase sigma factor (sigma-70 family)